MAKRTAPQPSARLAAEKAKQEKDTQELKDRRDRLAELIRAKDEVEHLTPEAPSKTSLREWAGAIARAAALLRDRQFAHCFAENRDDDNMKALAKEAFRIGLDGTKAAVVKLLAEVAGNGILRNRMGMELGRIVEAARREELKRQSPESKQLPLPRVVILANAIAEDEPQSVTLPRWATSHLPPLLIRIFQELWPTQSGDEPVPKLTLWGNAWKNDGPLRKNTFDSGITRLNTSLSNLKTDRTADRLYHVATKNGCYFLERL